MKRMDFVGLILAGACVVHCLAMPLVLVYLPLLGLSWLTDPKVHYVLLGAGLTLGGLSFLPGYRVHRRAWIPALAVTGLSTMAYAAVFQEDDCCRRPPANSVAEVMQTSHVARESATRGSVGRAVPTGNGMVGNAHPTGHQQAVIAGAKGLENDSDLPECCRVGHCATKEKSLLGQAFATVDSLGLTPYLPQSSTPVGATLLLIAHILNLRFRGYRGCTAECCPQEELTTHNLTADASPVPGPASNMVDPSDETTR